MPNGGENARSNMKHLIVMFNNAGIRYCYDKINKSYVVFNKDGKEEIRCGDALQVWVYYIQRVDNAVRKRILCAKEFSKRQ